MQPKNLKWFFSGLGLTFITAILVLAALQVSGSLAAAPEQQTDNPNLSENQSQLSSLAEPDFSSQVNNAASLSGTPLVVPAAEFRSNGFFPVSAQFVFATGTWRGTDTDDGCLMAPAYLPDGVTVTGLQVTFVDNDTSNDIVFDLYRVNTSDGDVTKMATLDSTAFPASPDFVVHATTTISNPVVAYPTYAYYLSTCLPSGNTKLAGMQVYYTSTP